MMLNTKPFFILLAIFLATAGLVVVQSPRNFQKEEPQSFIAVRSLQFETLAKGFYSGYNSKDFLVIKSDEELERVWNLTFSGVSPQPKPPEIDFSKQMLVAVFLGRRMTGGFSIQIESVVEHENKVVVHVLESSPAKNCIVTQALTSPYHMVVFERVDKPVVFQEESKIVECGK